MEHDYEGAKTSRSTRRQIRRGASDQRKRSHEAARTYHEPCCWSEPDLDKVRKRAVMTPYASFGRPKASLPRLGSPCLR